jgi:hypothetical protein
MSQKTTFAVLYTCPETVLDNTQRLFELTGGVDALPHGITTMPKDNIRECTLGCAESVDRGLCRV